MKDIKVFDVVELKSGEKATILNGSGVHYLVEIANAENKKNEIINVKDINKIIYTKNK